MLRTEHALRCVCDAAPVLGTFGVDTDGLPYVHVLIRKGRKVEGEVISKGGEIKIRCRVCERWNVVKIKNVRTAFLERVTTPEILAEA